ncbi:MAG: MBL fold metallo-hydrolase [Promethearchaeota archaeon]|nr:MAG: MBL fold metallo-hydrolase [Candidatus Lokiarchaeota archaeon]
MIEYDVKFADCALKNVPYGNDTIFIGGLMPHNNFKIPDWANGVVMRRNRTIYIIDTGAGIEYRERLKRAINQLNKNVEQIVLINTHSHADHIMNNDIINEFAEYEIQHLVHYNYPERIDQEELFLEYFTEIHRYYNYFTAPPYPYKIISVLGRLFMSQKKAFQFIIKKVMKKFLPNRSKTNVMKPLMKKDSIEKEFGGERFQVWKVGEIEVIESIGHSPDHLMVYDPKLKLLISGDETFQMFPTWPDTNTSNIIKNLNAICEASRDGMIEMFMDSHHQFILKSPEFISAFCGSILTSYYHIRDVVLSLVSKKKMSVSKIYEKICDISDHDQILYNLICMEFPRTPIFLKTVIASILKQNNAKFIENTKNWYLEINT